MTDRPARRLAAPDPRLAMLERRLGRMAAAPPPALGRRVLAAVDDVLAEPRRAVPSGARAAGPVPGWTWVAAAAVVVALAVPLLATVSPARRDPPVTLGERLRLAGVADDRLAVGLRDDPFGRHYAALTAPPRPTVAAVAAALAGPTADTGASRAAFRMIDTRRMLLEETP